MESEIMQFFVNQGVAIGVLIWFMFRMETVIRNNTKVIQDKLIAKK